MSSILPGKSSFISNHASRFFAPSFSIETSDTLDVNGSPYMAKDRKTGGKKPLREITGRFKTEIAEHKTTLSAGDYRSFCTRELASQEILVLSNQGNSHKCLWLYGAELAPLPTFLFPTLVFQDGIIRQLTRNADGFSISAKDD